MNHNKNFYITTTLPYVNAAPHVGFAMEIIRADALARFKEKLGYEVFFNTGTDEHGLKLWEAAQAGGEDVQDYVDRYAKDFQNLKDVLNLYPDLHFIRTTDENHIKTVQDFWKKVNDSGYIYKKTYQAKYCTGCELEKKDSELVDGYCPVHPNKELELIDEENYFFKFSEFAQPLLDFYNQNPNFVQPDFRFNEIKAFVERGLQDFSISRLKTKMPWGVPVPGDEDQVMYVWFDALVNYISTLGWSFDSAQDKSLDSAQDKSLDSAQDKSLDSAQDKSLDSAQDKSDNFKKFWEEGQTVQICGKDNLRQQSAMWQAMLMAAGEEPANTVLVNGFLNGPDGRKMSKSIGNVINPYDAVESFGTDALRFYLLHEVSQTEDSPISIEMIKESYTAHLVNGIGNLTNRIVKMASSYEVDIALPDPEEIWSDKEDVDPKFFEMIKKFDIRSAINFLFKQAKEMDEFITKEEPFKKIKVLPDEAKEDVARLMLNLWYMAVLLEPFLPEASAKIQQAVGTKTVPEEPIFPRL